MTDRSLKPLSASIGMATSFWPYSFPHEQFPEQELPEDIKKMLLGIQQYQKHSFKPEKQDIEEIWKQGTVTIQAIPGHDYDAHERTIILVPSLINKAAILDLMSERSMLRWLAAQGINAFLLDWGCVTDDPDQKDMDTLVMDRLVPALEFLHKKEGRPLHALGYCMGGTILMGAATHAQDKLASIILLAAPWDFHGGTQALLNRIKFWAPSAFPMIDEKGYLPTDWMQIIFASMDPAMTTRKFSKFSDMDQDSEEARLFVAVEDWLNDGVNLPGELALQCIKDLFLKNIPMRGEWQVGGMTVQPEHIRCPALIIASEKDRLVEFETASILQQKIQNVRLHNPCCGHIGMIAGRHSVDKVWRPVAEWILSSEFS